MAVALTLLALLATALALRGLHAPQAARPGRLGATFAGTAPVITSLQGGGAADEAGLRVGDVVLRAGGRRIGSLADVEYAMASGAPTDLRIRRGVREMVFVMP